MAFLIYVQGLRGPSPQIVFDDAGGKPSLGDAIRDHVLPSLQVKLSAAEEGMLRELERRYPPPGREPDDPAPVSPAPVLPKPMGGVLQDAVA